MPLGAILQDQPDPVFPCRLQVCSTADESHLLSNQSKLNADHPSDCPSPNYTNLHEMVPDNKGGLVRASLPRRLSWLSQGCLDKLFGSGSRRSARRKVGLEEATRSSRFRYSPRCKFWCCAFLPPRRSGHMSGRAAGEQKQGLFWRTIRAAHVVRRKRMHPGVIALEPATLPARRARDNPWFSLRHSLIQIHVIGFIAFRPIPGMPRGGVLPPTPVLAPGSALRSRPRVALSSAQVTSV